MRKTVLIAALLLVSASAQAGQYRNLSLTGASSHPSISAPLAPTPARVVAEAPTAPASQPPPAAVTAPAPAALAPVSAAPETGAPPVAAVPPAAPAVAAPATSETPKYVERPAVTPAATDTPKADDSKPSRRAERRHYRGGYWTAGRIMGELQRYGYAYGW